MNSVPLDQSNILGNAIASLIVDQYCWVQAWRKDRDSDCMRRVHTSEHAHIATNWCPTMNLATKYTENISFQKEKAMTKPCSTALQYKMKHYRAKGLHALNHQWGRGYPPYSPDLNPVEGVFSQAKSIMKLNDKLIQATTAPRAMLAMTFGMNEKFVR